METRGVQINFMDLHYYVISGPCIGQFKILFYADSLTLLLLGLLVGFFSGIYINMKAQNLSYENNKNKCLDEN